MLSCALPFPFPSSAIILLYSYNTLHNSILHYMHTWIQCKGSTESYQLTLASRPNASKLITTRWMVAIFEYESDTNTPRSSRMAILMTGTSCREEPGFIMRSISWRASPFIFMQVCRFSTYAVTTQNYCSDCLHFCCTPRIEHFPF